MCVVTLLALWFTVYGNINKAGNYHTGQTGPESFKSKCLDFFSI